MAHRKTANDWRKAHADAKTKVEKLENEISARLLELTKKYPDAIILNVGDTPIKSKSISSEGYIKSMNLSIQIACIEKIEEHIASLHPHKQLEINYDNTICNCIVRDMGTDFDEDGIRYCIHCGYTIK